MAILSQAEQDQIMPVSLFAESLAEMLDSSVVFFCRLLRIELSFHPEHFARTGNQQKRFRCHSIVALGIVRGNTALVSESHDPFSPITILKGERLINWTGSVPSTEGDTKETARVDRF